MYCKNCGAPMSASEKFCTKCGAPAQAEPVQSGVPQQPNVQPPYEQQMYTQQPYGQQAPKKSKAALWIAIVSVLVLGLAAVALFVWPGFLNGESASGNSAVKESAPIFSGDTVQTQFVNDSLMVFENAFDGFGGDTFEKLAKEPFDIQMDVTANASGMSQPLSLDIAYDKKNLGLNAEISGMPIKILLLEDVLYVDYFGMVQGIKFGSDADLSKEMSLGDRLTALMEGMQSSITAISGVTSMSYDSEDMVKILELFINSIDEKCFDKSGSKATLTLDSDSIVNALQAFSKELKKDDELLDAMNELVQQAGSSEDILDSIDSAIEEIESADSDFELEWVVEYEGAKAVYTEITLAAEGDEMVFSFGYEDNGSGSDIEFNMSIPDSDNFGGEFSFEKSSSGIEYSGSLNIGSEEIAVSGSEKWSGNKAEGTIEITVEGETVSIDYEETIKFGKPSKDVADDSRFAVDTDNAEITDLTDMSGMLY